MMAGIPFDIFQQKEEQNGPAQLEGPIEPDNESDRLKKTNGGECAFGRQSGGRDEQQKQVHADP